MSGVVEKYILRGGMPLSGIATYSAHQNFKYTYKSYNYNKLTNRNSIFMLRSSSKNIKLWNKDKEYSLKKKLKTLLLMRLSLDTLFTLI